jgi:hypothetical protein
MPQAPTHEIMTQVEEGLQMPPGTLQKLLERPGFYQAWITEVYSDWKDADERIKGAWQEVDSFLAVFGIDSTNRAQAIMKVTTGRWEELTDRPAADDPRTLGRFIFELAYYDLDIESDEAGPASAHIQLRSPYGFMLELSAEGGFWTDRKYTDPTTGVARWSGDLTDAEGLELSSDEKIKVDSEVNFSLRFECNIEKDKEAK